MCWVVGPLLTRRDGTVQPRRVWFPCVAGRHDGNRPTATQGTYLPTPFGTRTAYFDEVQCTSGKYTYLQSTVGCRKRYPKRGIDWGDPSDLWRAANKNSFLIYKLP